MIRCVVFDFDGTLVQSNAVKRQTFYDAAALLGDVSDIVDGVLAECRGDRYVLTQEIVKRAAAAGRLSARDGASLPEALARRYTELCDDAIAACPFVPRACEALDELRRGGRDLFIDSATPPAPLASAVRRLGLEGYFRAVWGNEHSKADNLRAAIAISETSAAGTVFVGDGEPDRAAAAEVGCHFVGVLNEFSDFREPPGTVVRDLGGLPGIVEALP